MLGDSRRFTKKIICCAGLLVGGLSFSGLEKKVFVYKRDRQGLRVQQRSVEVCSTF